MITQPLSVSILSLLRNDRLQNQHLYTNVTCIRASGSETNTTLGKAQKYDDDDNYDDYYDDVDDDEDDDNNNNYYNNYIIIIIIIILIIVIISYKKR